MMSREHITIISAPRFLLPFARAECSPLEVCLKGTFKTQSQTFVWLFFLAFRLLLAATAEHNKLQMLITFQLSVLTGRSHVLFFRESADTKKGPCGPFVIRYSEVISAS